MRHGLEENAAAQLLHFFERGSEFPPLGDGCAQPFKLLLGEGHADGSGVQILLIGPERVLSIVIANNLLLKRERCRKEFCQRRLFENVDAHNLQNFVQTFL
jgi:hypothetical protein